MATIKDVAREAGLTVGTVSRVLNNRGYISEKTRQDVYRVMKELNYRPNEVARSLTRQRTNTIGVIVPNIIHPYFAKMIHHLEEEAREHNLKILLYNSHGSQREEKKYLEMCKSNQVSGIVLFSAEVDEKIFSSLNIPIVTIERYVEHSTASVVCDNMKGGMLAAAHLIERGCENLLLLGGVGRNGMPADYRERGFLQICQENAVEAKVYRSNLNEAEIMLYEEDIKRALQENPQTDGIFACSDLMAAQSIRVCQELGRRVPEDIKVVGFDDVNVASLSVPTITTIQQPIQEMARIAVDFLRKSVEGGIVPEKTVMPVKLVERGSTQA